MNVTIVAVDKLRERYLRDGCALYVKRLAPYAGISMAEVRKSSVAGEGRAIFVHLADGDVLWAVDGGGEMLSSIDLAHRISRVERSGTRRLVLAIGGPDGLDRAVIDRADFVWSLSPLTFLHEMARLIVLEQLYRAAKIARDEPYHR
jgi:23S rRNA (pseudouridine1915-N3)-methyltransferase